MTLNIKKTKVMIFNKGGRHIRRNIYFGDNRIETTRQYKYLGFIFSNSSTEKRTSNLINQAQKAWFAIRFYLSSANKNSYLLADSKVMLYLPR